jgi:predicted MFS family arabinose efflux permease
MAAPAPISNESSWRYAGWRVVAACFLAAVFCWGFALYGHGVYITELNRLHGWPTASVSIGVTGFYLMVATVVIFINDAITRFGPKLVMLAGACCFGAGVSLMPFIVALWQLYAVYLLMAVGAATVHVGAISNVVGLWFDRKRGLALSLALNGASTGGILVTPLLVLAIERYGFANAIIGAMLIGAFVLLPAVALWIDRPERLGKHPAATPAVPAWTRGRALRSPQFWTVAATFAAGLTAQVSFLVHQIPILEPALGRAQAGLTVAMLAISAIFGRFALGAVADRVNMRTVTALTLTSQALALAAMSATANAPALIAACLVFGVSTGNLITLPALVIHREFEAASFGVLVALSWAITQYTYSFGPGLIGIIRDATGSYTMPLVLLAALDLAAAIVILWRPRTS